MMFRWALLAIFCVLLCLPADGSWADSSPIPAADYTVARTWQLGGNGYWDYLALDDSGSRLFMSRQDRVDVVDTATGRMVGSIPHTQGVHGIAFAPELKRGFTSNGKANTVTVFELDNLRVIQEIAVSGTLPDAILYEPLRNLILTANRESSNLTVIDAGTLQVTATIPLPGPPEFMATDNLGNVYVNVDLAPGKLVLIDAKTLTVKAKWPLTGCANPTSLALDVGNHRAFSVCSNQVLAVTDSVSGKNIARTVIGRGSDGVAFDPDLGLIFSANGIDGTLTVVHQDSPDEYRVTATVTTQVSARTLALDPLTHRIYLAAAQFGPTPAPTPETPNPRAPLAGDSFVILTAQPR
jgi:YVTN family beta-propeller protein